MIFPRTRAWTALQKRLIVSAVVLGVVVFGVLVYEYERYYRGPSDQILVGTWEDPWPDGSIYYQLSANHDLRLFVDNSDVLAAGRWYAGGNFVFMRWGFSDEPEVSHGLIWRIDEILPNEIHVHKNPNGLPFTFTRTHLPGHPDTAAR
jgi:hypothetical protein